jgi:hypothetical protein
MAGHADTAPLADGVSIDVGGSGSGAFVADEFSDGRGEPDSLPAGALSDANFPATVANPIPDAVWDTSTFLASSYDITGLTPGGSYQFRLYCMDWYFHQAGQREFDVSVNGTTVLTNFDIVGTALAAGADGQEAFGVERDFTVTANSAGSVEIDFTRGAANQPQVNAIALVPSSSS